MTDAKLYLVGGGQQSGVFGMLPWEYTYGGKAMEKKIIVLGGLGVSERRDRDPDRVLSRGGYHLHTPGAHRQG